MKKKLFLLPTILTVTTPLIGLVGCGKQYIDVELKEDGGNQYETDVMTFEKGKYYRFYVNILQNETTGVYFGFYDNIFPHLDKKLNVDVIKVVADKQVVDYEETSEDNIWYMFFTVDTSITMLEIYIKVNETKENFKAYLD